MPVFGMTCYVAISDIFVLRKELMPSLCPSIENDAYFMVLTAKIWTDARSYCRQHYTDLPTIHNSKENNQINKILLSGYYIWIGLFLDSWECGSVWIGLKRGTQKRWGWSNGENTTSQYYNWASGQPNVNEDCAITYAGAWHDTHCSHLYYFTCYTSKFFCKKFL
uniref:C-type lectin domain-containing protein n=1 Tax=Cyprinus carpio carpio TaxID=630221 RepID=A0A9J8A041_CYPCA